jgi:hypothetical protein
MIIDDDEIELAVQFQREADALLRDLLKAKYHQEPHMFPEDLPTYIHLLCSRWEAAIEAEYRGDGCFDIRPRSHPDYRGDASGLICDRSTDQLIDDIFTNAGDRIAMWRSELEREIHEWDARDARANLHVVSDQEDES